MAKFLEKFELFNRFIAQHTVPELISGTFQTGFKPPKIVGQNEYDLLRDLSLQANNLADIAWNEFDLLIESVLRSIPEALDEDFTF